MHCASGPALQGVYVSSAAGLGEGDVCEEGGGVDANTEILG